MYQSLDKGNKGNSVALAEIEEYDIWLTLRSREKVRNLGEILLTGEELVTLCKRAIKKGCFKKEDL